ncbi:MAG: DoxX family membrane protein [Candidatus Babeliales bacterium]|nr:DoxX family membrane protein [Candidatus Babeliales bacterium]
MIGSSFTAQKTYNTWLLLRIAYGLLFIVVGVDKFFNYIVNWGQYVSPVILDKLFPDLYTLILIVSVVEILLGLLVLTKWTRAGAYGMAVWFLIIAVNLVTTFHFFDIAARDVILAIGAIALARLTEIKDEIK